VVMFDVLFKMICGFIGLFVVCVGLGPSPQVFLGLLSFNLFLMIVLLIISINEAKKTPKLKMKRRKRDIYSYY